MATILIVEDEEAISVLLKYNLEKAGYETIIVSHGNRVLSAVEKNIPSLILLDWMLPEISGLELCKIIRNNYFTANWQLVCIYSSIYSVLVKLHISSPIMKIK